MPLLQIDCSVCPEVDISSLSVGEPTIRFVVGSEFRISISRFALCPAYLHLSYAHLTSDGPLRNFREGEEAPEFALVISLLFLA